MVSGCQFSRTREGAIAQLGERLNGIQEVVGSIPISSTNKNKGLRFLIVSPCFVPVPFEKNWLPAGSGHGVNGPPLPPASTFCPGRQAWQWLQKKSAHYLRGAHRGQRHGIKETFCRADALHARFCQSQAEHLNRSQLGPAVALMRLPGSGKEKKGPAEFSPQVLRMYW